MAQREVTDMEGNEILLDSTDDFIDRMRELDVTAVAAAVIDEKRVREEEPGKLSVYHRKSTELIAYRDAVIYKCRIDDADADALCRRLEAEGFDVKKTSRNIV